MNEIVIRGRICSPENPAICVSVTEKDIKAFANKAIEYANAGVDAVELRADFLGNEILNNHDMICQMLKDIRQNIGDTILIFTIRTIPEGGTIDIAESKISSLYKAILESDTVDVFDIEYSQIKGITELSEAVRRGGALTIASHHNFTRTYSSEEITAMFSSLKNSGADIAKMALMPESEADVENLINSAGDFAKANPDTAVIAISMGALGMKSRISCNITGSMLTFAAIENASAPGQIGFDRIKELLNR